MRRTLRQYHDSRQEATATALMAALQRMHEKQTVRLTADFKWSKTNWAKEADININTIVTKTRDGSFTFADANLAFERYAHPRRTTKDRYRQRITELEAENHMLRTTIANFYNPASK